MDYDLVHFLPWCCCCCCTWARCLCTWLHLLLLHWTLCPSIGSPAHQPSSGGRHRSSWDSSLWHQPEAYVNFSMIKFNYGCLWWIQSIQQENPHLCDPADGCQILAYLKKSDWRCWGLAPEAGRTILINNEGLVFEETEQMGRLFTLAHSDLKPQNKYLCDSLKLHKYPLCNITKCWCLAGCVHTTCI